MADAEQHPDQPLKPGLQGIGETGVMDVLHMALDTGWAWGADHETGRLASQSGGAHREGDLISNFRLVSLLGEGGFGKVWRAVQKEPLVREVALKVIKPGMDSREVISRFEGERQALALMDHPNIARVLDAGTTAGGQPWFAMELVQGAPLTEYCDSHRLDLRQRLALFIPVCQAVHHAHQKGILHRDLKPSNILVEEVDGKPVPKVIDFGIAKALDASDHAPPGLSLLQTRGLAMVGTPHYMSPEQAGLGGLDVDSRSDIYSLGVILYELLSGTTPLAALVYRKTPQDELLRIIREQEPPSLSRHFRGEDPSLEQIARSRSTDTKRLYLRLRGDLDWLVAKAVEKDRDRRYNSAAAFAEDIQRHLLDEPISAGPPGALYRFGKAARRNKTALVAAGLVAASLLAGTGVAVWQAVRAIRAERVAFARLQESEATRDAAGDLLVGNLVKLRDRLLPLGRADIMDEVLSSVEAYFDKLPGGMHNPVLKQQHIFLHLNRCAIALARGNTQAARDSLDAGFRLVWELESTNQLPESVARETSFMSLIVVTEMGRLDETNSARPYVEQARRLCLLRLDQDENTVWALEGMVHAAAVLAFTAAMFEGETALAMEQIEAVLDYRARLEAVAPESVELKRATAYAKLAQAFVASASGMPKALVIRLFQNSSDTFMDLYQSDLQSPWWEFYLYLNSRASSAAAWRMVLLGAETGNDGMFQQGRDLVLRSYEKRLATIEIEPERADLWQDLVLNAKQLVALARTTSDKEEAARLMTTVLRDLARAAERPMTPGAVNRASQALREWISQERLKAKPRIDLIADATLLGINIACRGLGEEDIHPFLLLPWNTFTGTLHWLATQPEIDAAQWETGLEKSITELQAPDAAEGTAAKSLLVSHLRLAVTLLPLARQTPGSVQSSGERLREALRSLHESRKLSESGKIIAFHSARSLGDAMLQWFKRAANEAPAELRSEVAADLELLILNLDALAHRDEAAPIDCLLAWAGWQAVQKNKASLPAALVAQSFERMGQLMQHTGRTERDDPLFSLVIAIQLSILVEMAEQAEVIGDAEAAARHWAAIIEIRQSMPTKSARHYYHWSLALFHHGVFDWRSGRHSAALKSWKEAERHAVKSVRLNQQDPAAAALHLAIRVALLSAPDQSRRVNDKNLATLAAEYQTLASANPRVNVHYARSAWEILEQCLAKNGHPSLAAAASHRAALGRDGEKPGGGKTAATAAP